MAAFRPGAPVMEPPGWVVAPVWYSPGIGPRGPEGGLELEAGRHEGLGQISAAEFAEPAGAFASGVVEVTGALFFPHPAITKNPAKPNIANLVFINPSALSFSSGE